MQMIEYVVDLTNVKKVPYESMSFEMMLNNVPLREKIVRCRDCEHGIKADLSGNLYECMKPDGNGDYARWFVKPDGFCSEGKKKEGGDD